MSSTDAVGTAYFDPAISRALVPVQQSSTAQNSEQPLPQPPPAVPPTASQRITLEARVDLLQRHSLGENGASNRSLQALKAYKSLSDDREREQISRLLGVDEYA